MTGLNIIYTIKIGDKRKWSGIMTKKTFIKRMFIILFIVWICPKQPFYFLNSDDISQVSFEYNGKTIELNKSQGEKAIELINGIVIYGCTFEIEKSLSGQHPNPIYLKYNSGKTVEVSANFPFLEINGIGNWGNRKSCELLEMFYLEMAMEYFPDEREWIEGGVYSWMYERYSEAVYKRN